jgi:ubiquinone/menaquinone biosynthesis C-methylase UbiE
MEQKGLQFREAERLETFRVNLENEKIPVPNKEFDIVISLEVIERAWNTENYLTEVKRIFK